MAGSPLAFLNATAAEVAPQLLGCELIRELDGQIIRVRIVEVEAYDQTDAASHSFRGETLRSKVMFGESGHLYVYFTYGMHYCANIVTGPKGVGSGVLIRAVEPIEGIEVIRRRRGDKLDHQLTDGPAKTCQALNIDMNLSGHDLKNAPLQLSPKPSLPSRDVGTSVRIGISQAKDTLWRFYIKGNSYVSAKHTN